LTEQSTPANQCVREEIASPAADFNHVMIAAGVIFLVLRFTPMGEWLSLVPILGPSLPFFGLALYVLIREWIERKSLAALGIRAPESIAIAGLLTIGGFIVLRATTGALSELLGLEPDLTRMELLHDNLTLLFAITPLMWIIAGFGEEVLHRGFVLIKVAHILGREMPAWIPAVLIQSLIFGIGHIYQGLGGVLLTTISGIIFGTLYLLAKRNIWPGIIVHAASNTWGFYQIYLGN
jgi:hypothetical protein